MKAQIKKELTLTLSDTEIEELKSLMKHADIWSFGELKMIYQNTSIEELWKIISGV